jgi:cytochrome c2
MPVQRIRREDDRKDLIAYLRRATGAGGAGAATSENK